MLRSGTKLTAVSYRSGGESIAAVLSQSVHATFENIAILGALIKDGKLRALARAKHEPHAAAAGCADHGGSGLRGRRGLHLLRARRTGRHAGADHRIASTAC